jgi:peptidoglycan/LPS O-acetylase OafA/YrhL
MVMRINQSSPPRRVVPLEDGAAVGLSAEDKGGPAAAAPSGPAVVLHAATGAEVSAGHESAAKRNNSFDLIRHFAALLVLYSHHFALSQRPEPQVPYWDTYGFVAVAIFFSISGYFMPESFRQSGNFIRFIGRRVRRIFPGLIVCSFLMTYVLGTVFTVTPTFEYLTSKWTFDTFLQYSVFFGRVIPGVFSNFLFPNAINGSLWTLPIEFLCYIIIGAALSLSGSWKMALALFITSVLGTIYVFRAGVSFDFYAVPLNYLGVFGVCFSAGALLSMTKDAWFSARFPLVIFSLVSLYVLRGRPEIQTFGSLGIAILTIVIGESFSERLINGKFDISYGIYIYAFPVQQITINLLTRNFWLSMAISVALTLGLAALSYRFVERPFLKARPKDRRPTGAAGA